MARNNHDIRFRIYQRKDDHAAFLWDSYSLNTSQKNNIEIFFSDIGNIEKKMKFRLASPAEIKDLGLPPSLVMAVIGHEENEIDPGEPYTAKLVLGKGDDILEETKEVLPAGILPVTECDNKFRNVHMYAFNPKINKWQKVEGVVDKQGRFGFVVVME
jgi:hypothetical protein